MSEQGNPPGSEPTGPPPSRPALPPSSGPSSPTPGAPARPAKKAAKKVPAKKAPAPGAKATPPPIDDTSATVKGAVLIVAALVVGGIVFAKGYSNESNLVTEDAARTTTTLESPVSTIDRNAPPTVTLPEQGTTIPPTPSTKLAPKDVKVIVANAADPAQPVAGNNGTKLKNAGYVNVQLTDMPVTTASHVYYSPDMQGEAQAIADALGLPSSSVAAMPSPPPTGLKGAQILVVIGTDHK